MSYLMWEIKLVVTFFKGGHRPKSRNHMKTTIGWFLFIGGKICINFGSTIASLDAKHEIIYNLV